MSLTTEEILSKVTILYVEDEEFNRDELSKFFSRRTKNLIVAENGEDGLFKFKQHRPDLIITDLKMPYMDGIEMIRQIRALGSNVPVIIISALSDSETILRAVDLGIAKYVVKPVNLRDLLNAVHETLIKTDSPSPKGEKNALTNNFKEKSVIERNIKSEFAHFLKKTTSKGPLDVKVFLRNNDIEIIASGVLTTYEQSIIANNTNYLIIDYLREIFYLESCEELLKSIEAQIDRKCSIKLISTDSKENRDSITISFD